jgi:ribosomal protein L13
MHKVYIGSDHAGYELKEKLRVYLSSLGYEVEVTNISKLDITTKKKEQTLYKRYSGYPGGLKIETFDKLSKRLGFGDAFRKTVSGMLPKNKLRDKMLKNLVITE